MSRKSDFEILKIETSNIALLWKSPHGFAPENAALKLDTAMLDWQNELTKTLEIWIIKGLEMTDGELILARANLGAVVESWLRFFYCVFYNDYLDQPKKSKYGKILEPETREMSFETLKHLSTGILWDNKESKEYLWVDSIQHKRNAIHSFTYRDIGTPADFLLDIDHLCKFVDIILSRLPPIEDYIDSYPQGYVFPY